MVKLFGVKNSTVFTVFKEELNKIRMEMMLFFMRELMVQEN